MQTTMFFSVYSISYVYRMKQITFPGLLPLSPVLLPMTGLEWPVWILGGLPTSFLDFSLLPRLFVVLIMLIFCDFIVFWVVWLLQCCVLVVILCIIFCIVVYIGGFILILWCIACRLLVSRCVGHCTMLFCNFLVVFGFCCRSCELHFTFLCMFAVLFWFCGVLYAGYWFCNMLLIVTILICVFCWLLVLLFCFQSCELHFVVLQYIGCYICALWCTAWIGVAICCWLSWCWFGFSVRCWRCWCLGWGRVFSPRAILKVLNLYL